MRALLILFAGILSVLLLSTAAGAMPADEGSEQQEGAETGKDGFYEHVVETRRSARDRYRAMRQERLEELNLSSARGAGHRDEVPGWKLGEAPVAPPVKEEADTKGLYLIILLGAGVVLSLALRVFAPSLFYRKAKGMQAGEPMTIKLKPREDRNLKRI